MSIDMAWKGGIPRGRFSLPTFPKLFSLHGAERSRARGPRAPSRRCLPRGWDMAGSNGTAGDFGESILHSPQPVPVLPNKGPPPPVPRSQGSHIHKLCALPSAEPKPHCGDVRPRISAQHVQLQPRSVLATYRSAAASVARCGVCPPAPFPGAFQEMLEMLKMLRNVPGSAPGQALGSSQAPAG